MDFFYYKIWQCFSEDFPYFERFIIEHSTVITTIIKGDLSVYMQFL